MVVRASVCFQNGPMRDRSCLRHGCCVIDGTVRCAVAASVTNADIVGAMAAFRFLSALFMLVAIVALAADATPLLAGDATPHLTSALQRWTDIAPGSLASAEQSLTDKGWGAVWTSVLRPILSVPAFPLFAGLALVFGYFGRQRRRIKVYVN
jgi:hypothetical protein